MTTTDPTANHLRIFGELTRTRIAEAIVEQKSAQRQMVTKVASLLVYHQRESVFAELLDTMRASPDHACTAAAAAILTLAEAELGWSRP
jgi:hypothetical protein